VIAPLSILNTGNVHTLSTLRHCPSTVETRTVILSAVIFNQKVRVVELVYVVHSNGHNVQAAVQCAPGNNFRAFIIYSSFLSRMFLQTRDCIDSQTGSRSKAGRTLGRVGGLELALRKLNVHAAQCCHLPPKNRNRRFGGSRSCACARNYSRCCRRCLQLNFHSLILIPAVAVAPASPTTGDNNLQ